MLLAENAFCLVSYRGIRDVIYKDAVFHHFDNTSLVFMLIYEYTFLTYVWLYVSGLWLHYSTPVSGREDKERIPFSLAALPTAHLYLHSHGNSVLCHVLWYQPQSTTHCVLLWSGDFFTRKSVSVKCATELCCRVSINFIFSGRPGSGGGACAYYVL